MKKTVLTLTFALVALFAQAQQRQAFVAKTTEYGQLKSIIGENADEIDSLVVEGPINAEDFGVIWECAFYGKLEALNLGKAEIEGGVIPDEALFNRKVQEIDGFTFYTTGLREVILPEGVTEIGKGAFRCSCIERINLPTTLRKIGMSCFYLCDFLNPCPLRIPEGIDYIPADCFRGCRKLTEVQLPESLKAIGWSAFFGCWEMNCNFPDNLEYIDGYAFFEGCGLKSVHLPQGCVNLGEACFDGCENLAEFTFPDGITHIPDFCLDYTPALKEIEIPSSVRTIGGQAFCQSGIRNVIVPEGVETIGEQAFAHNWLETVVLPSTLKYIGGQACRGLTNLVKIISYAQTPATCGMLFNEGPFRPDAAPLYVPKGTAELYRNAQGWNVLSEIIEMEDGGTTGIRPVSTDFQTRRGIYDIRGRKLNAEPEHGIFIKDGRKIVRQ